MLRWIKALLALAVCLVFTWALHTKHGDAPPFASLLSPYRGFWRNGEAAGDFPDRQTLHVAGLKQPVQVRFDQNRVAHVFAQNDHDLYLAQGYLTARDRLWQMEFQTHVAAGRISEVVGDKALEYDRFQRRMGLPFGAENSLRAMQQDPTTRRVLDAYTAGVNAYIAELTPATLPFEYKLLDYRPEPWRPLKCALLLKLMAWDLSGRSDDLRLSNALGRYGRAVVNDLFPNYSEFQDPIIPPGTKPDFTPLPVPQAPAASSPLSSSRLSQPEPDAELGSNNFAVSGSKSATGYPILANDPHLQLNLPSIWYQIQLVAPGVNVYGVTIPGAPTVIGGFNENVAWGVTNVAADVLDFYQLKFKDAGQREYWHDGRWKPVRWVVERIRVRGRPDLLLDTVLYTHHGPVVYQRAEKPFNPQTPIAHALRWTAHDGANEVRCFYLLNRARTHADYRAALAQYGSPAQNFVFADALGDIAISPNGRFPLKYRDQGKFVLDGTDPQQDWQGWIPAAQNPHVLNPPRGFVSSANQFPVAPQDYPYYLGWTFATADRGHRINERLARMNAATPDSLRQLQNDNLSVNARRVLPLLLRQLPAAAALPAAQRPAVAALSGWNYCYDADAVQPAIWELWYGELLRRLWEDDFPTRDPAAPALRYPDRDRTNRLLLQEADTSRWVDDRRTPAVRETLPQLARESFAYALDSLTRKFGPDVSRWRWATQKSTDVLHLARLPGFGHPDLNCGGGAGIVNATSERNGPSWRLVVALGPQGPRGYGVYPGGQSGNPGSPFYDNLLETWRVGKLNELVFLRSAEEADPRVGAQWELR